MLWRSVLALLALLTLAACGTRGVPGGVLRIQVSGLPAGVQAAVQVVGPDQSQQIVTASTDLSVPAGVYTVKGLVVGGQSQDAPVYRPVGDAQDVTVGAGAGAVVQVAYQQVVTRVSSNARVADAATTSALVSLSEADGRTTLSFSASTPQLAALQPGQILVLGTSAAAPDGHLGRIVSVNGTTVVTEPASLQDVVEEGAFTYTATLDATDPGTVLPQGVRPSASLGQCLAVDRNLNVQGSALSAAAGVAVRVSGTVCINAGIRFGGVIRVNELPDLYFGVSASATSNLRVAATANVTTPAGEAPFDFPALEVPVFMIEYKAITITMGAVPVVFRPRLTVYVGAGGTVTTGLTFGVNASASVGGGFSFDGEQKRFIPWASRSESFTPVWPTPTSTLDLRAYISPSVSVNVYGLAGPFVRLDPYLRYRANIGPSVDWKLFGGLDLSTGVAVIKELGLNLSYSKLLFNVEREILNNTAAPTPGQTTAKIPGPALTGGLVAGPDGTVYAGSGNSVRAFPHGLAPSWTYPTSNSVVGVIRGDDGTIYAWDFGGSLYAINPDGSEKWKRGPLGNLEIRRAALTADGRLVTAGGNTVRTFATATGEPGWSEDVGESVYAVAIDKAGNLWSNGSESLRKHDPASGDVLATVAAPSSPGGLALAADGTVYVRTSSTLTAVAPDATVRWWSTLSGADEWGTPAVGPDGTIYLCGTPPQARLYAVNPQNGQEKWSHWHNQVCDATPAVSNDGHVYIVTDGSVRSIRASDGSLAWSVPAESSGEGTSPLLLNRSLVTGTNSGLLGIGASGQLATGTWAREGGDTGGTGRLR